MARFFVEADKIKNGMAAIEGPDAKHISRVLRMEAGQVLTLVSTTGEQYQAVITAITGREVLCRIEARLDNTTEPPISVTLFQGLPKGEKMELILQKSTEIGVNRIVPVISERTVVKLEGSKAADRRVRWQRVAMEAAKQAGRTLVPEVVEPVKLLTALKNISKDCLSLMPWEEERGRSIKNVLQKGRGVREVAIFIGPEGGFSRTEAETALEHGVLPVSLGPRILRTETAGIAAVTLVLYELGDLGGREIE